MSISGRGSAWLGTGTHASLVEASHFVQILGQGLHIACPGEIPFRLGYISLDQFCKLAQRTAKSRYGDYLMLVIINLRLSAETMRADGHALC